MTLLSAVLGTSSEAARDDNTLALLKYGYANFTVRTPIRAGTVLGRPPIKDQSGKYAVVVAGRSLTRVIARSERVHVRLRLPRQLAGPLRRHTVVGTAVVFAGTRQIARVPLVLAHPVPAVSPLTRAARFITRPSTLVSLAVLLVAAIALAVLRTRGPRKREVEPA
jgi:D-alanyl-D-alanine carboxypeptidase (penicillin-binding protein 5/6)